MVDQFTRNYNLLLPKESDVMNQQVTPQSPGLVQNLRDAFEAFERAANPVVVSTLPATSDDLRATDKVGCRYYHSGTQSSYILLSKSIFWGCVWRPIQAALSPWRTPNGAYLFLGSDGADWQLHPTRPLAFALDNKGNCYWRGAIQKKVLGITPNSSFQPFNDFPAGLKHHTSGMFTLAIDPATPQSDTGLAGYKGGRLYLDATGYSSIRFHNSASAQDVYFDGIWYPNSLIHYYSP